MARIVVKNARERATLTVEQMAQLVDCEPEQVRAYEAGVGDFEIEVLERYARVFGLSLARFLNGEAEGSPATLLFRLMITHDHSFEDYLDLNAHPILGEFLRCTQDISDLENLLGERPTLAWLDGISFNESHDALELARSVRRYLNLGIDPVLSMVTLLQERLGIELFFVDIEILDRAIDGASALNPRPAILCNLVSGGEHWWRTRMILAHELCHILFDRHVLDPEGRKFFLFSPHEPLAARVTRPPRWCLTDNFANIERRANAFAAYFLAPPEGVRNLVANIFPASDEAIRRVCSTYMVGRQTAINLLTSVYALPRSFQLEMQGRFAQNPLPMHHPDVCTPSNLRSERFMAHVRRAFVAQLIGATDARRLLNNALSDPTADE